MDLTFPHEGKIYASIRVFFPPCTLGSAHHWSRRIASGFEDFFGKDLAGPPELRGRGLGERRPDTPRWPEEEPPFP